VQLLVGPRNKDPARANAFTLRDKRGFTPLLAVSDEQRAWCDRSTLPFVCSKASHKNLSQQPSRRPPPPLIPYYKRTGCCSRPPRRLAGNHCCGGVLGRQAGGVVILLGTRKIGWGRRLLLLLLLPLSWRASTHSSSMIRARCS